jgi:hypothetical protein
MLNAPDLFGFPTPNRKPTIYYSAFPGGTPPPFGDEGDILINTNNGDKWYKRYGTWVIYGDNAYYFQGIAVDPTTPTDGQVLVYSASALKYVPTSGGGNGFGWKEVINESGSSFTNWTGVVGTWSSDGTVINQTATTAADQAARYNTIVPTSLFVAQFDVKINSVGASSAFAGFILCLHASAGLSSKNTGLIQGDASNSNAVGNNLTGVGEATIAITNIAHGTWITMKIMCVNNTFDFFVNGVSLGAIQMHQAITPQIVDSFGLYTNSTSASFRNIQVWVPQPF